MKRSFDAIFFLVFASLLAANQPLAHAVETDPPGPRESDEVVKAGANNEVTVYKLPAKYKQILLTDDNKIYAIEYSLYSVPAEDKPNKPKSLPGVSVGQWYSDDVTGKFFPWRNNSDLAKELSSESYSFLEENRPDLLDEDGNLNLYSYDNGGGFIYEFFEL